MASSILQAVARQTLKSRFTSSLSLRTYSSSSVTLNAAAAPQFVDHVVIGGGPVGTATAWQLMEKITEEELEQSVVLIHDPKNHGAHEDWSRLARLSFDGPKDELDLSRHAVDLLDLVDEVRSYQSGAPVVPLRPGMLFVASPNTPMAQACAHAEEQYGDDQFIRRHPSELSDIYPGNEFNLPDETLCWSHPTGLCVSPIELCSAQLKTAKAYGVEIEEGIANLDQQGDDILVTTNTGKQFLTNKAYLMAGAQNREILEQSLARGEDSNADLDIPEFDNTYITAISTIRYEHVNTPTQNPDTVVATPITLGQLELPGLIDFQANFSIVAEEMSDVLKTRLSGSIGSEVIEYTKDLHTSINEDDNEQMKEIYQLFFGTLFPFLKTEKPLDFNRCVTYRNHGSQFSGTSLLEKSVSNKSSVLTTAGCFGVGVKFGPALGEAAASHALGMPVEQGMHIFQSGDESLKVTESDKLERAW